MLYPVLTESRLLSDLSGVWDFKLDNEHGFEEEWYARPLEDKMTMPVPASYNDLKEGVSFRDHYGWVFYQRTISVPRFVREQQRVVLRCDAVTHHARVYLNGEEIIEHRGGFLPFEVEIGGLLKDGDNLLTIAVDNVIDHTTLPVGGMAPWMSASSVTGDETVSWKKENYPNFDFFNYCGITRPVKIYTTPETYISDITLTADVEDPLADNVKASVNFRIDVAGTEAEQVCCKVEIFDRTGKKAGEGEGREGRILLENVTLWQPGNAYLYTVKVTAGEDVYELPYGIRTVKVEGTKFLINGRSFYFKGYGKHEDTFPAGRGMNIPMYVKDLSIMRWQGANSFRTSHYPYSEEMMQLADEEGFVIIDETPAVGVTFDTGGRVMVDGKKIGTFDKEHGIRTFEHHKEVIRDMILRDKNHASVVMWSIANEPDSYTEGAYEYFAPLFELARELDPEKRPCTLISVQTAGGPDTDVSAKLSDVICLNRYYGWYFGGPDIAGPMEIFRKELKAWEQVGKPLIITEFGADTVMGFHDTTPVMYTEEYQLDYYKLNHQVLDEFAFVTGEQAWNFADFMTSQGLLRVQGNKKGLFTRDRKPKLVAHYFRERWHKIPDFDYEK